MATMKASLYITIAAVLGGSLAALSAAAWPQGVDPQDKANRYGAATGQSNDSGGPPPADDTLRQRRDAGFPGPGTLPTRGPVHAQPVATSGPAAAALRIRLQAQRPRRPCRAAERRAGVPHFKSYA
jgi:hypothetical protein